MNKFFRGSLKQKLVQLILASAALSVLLYFALNACLSFALDRYFEMSTYIDSEYDKTAKDLQNYVSEYGVAMGDDLLLTDWAAGHKAVQLSVYCQDELVFSSDSSDESGEASFSEQNLGFDRVRYYPIEFSDGAADVYLFGSFDYTFYVYTEIAEVALCIGVFFLLVMLGVRDRINYIRQLEQDIGAMEGGELNHPVTVRGSDELGSLAARLDEMRVSFAHQVRTEREATEANRSLVTNMSHDLRTPLTALLLYTQILQDGKYRDEDEMRGYLDKIYSRGVQIKNLSDELFHNFLVDRTPQLETETENLRDVFPDVLSDFVCALEAEGFTAAAGGEWPDAEFQVNEESLMRIMDNLLSNIFKYADKSEPIRIAFSAEGDQFVLKLSNRVSEAQGERESSGIGFENITAMMRLMDGRFTAGTEGGVFTAVLSFRIQFVLSPGESRSAGRTE